MEFKKFSNEIVVIILATVILAISVSFRNNSILLAATISFLIIIALNILAKKISAYMLETEIRTKFWDWSRFGFKKTSHFKKPIPMAWLPLIVSLFTKGIFWWLAILEFDVEAKAERASKRHGLYRFTEVTEWHIAWIATWGILINIAAAIIGYLAGFELFAKLSIYYAAWSIVPLSSLDGSKIFFGSRSLWVTIAAIVLIFLGWGLLIV